MFCPILLWEGQLALRRPVIHNCLLSGLEKKNHSQDSIRSQTLQESRKGMTRFRLWYEKEINLYWTQPKFRILGFIHKFRISLWPQNSLVHPNDHNTISNASLICSICKVGQYYQKNGDLRKSGFQHWKDNGGIDRIGTWFTFNFPHPPVPWTIHTIHICMPVPLGPNSKSFWDPREGYRCRNHWIQKKNGYYHLPWNN